jgi:hypothetical protein
MFDPVTMAKSGIQTRRQAKTLLPEFNLHQAGSIKHAKPDKKGFKGGVA